jgi:hypothetical protein
MMDEYLTTGTALIVGFVLAAFAAPALKRELGALPGAVGVAAAAGVAVWLLCAVVAAALVVAAMAFSFASLGRFGDSAPWISRDRGCGARSLGGASGRW